MTDVEIEDEMEDNLEFRIDTIHRTKLVRQPPAGFYEKENATDVEIALWKGLVSARKEMQDLKLLIRHSGEADGEMKIQPEPRDLTDEEKLFVSSLGWNEYGTRILLSADLDSIMEFSVKSMRQLWDNLRASQQEVERREEDRVRFNATNKSIIDDLEFQIASLKSDNERLEKDARDSELRYIAEHDEACRLRELVGFEKAPQ